MSQEVSKKTKGEMQGSCLSSSIADRHAQLQGWATRISGCTSSKLINGISSHMFAKMLTTSQVDAFAHVVSIATQSEHQGYLSGDGKSCVVLSARLNHMSASEEEGSGCGGGGGTGGTGGTGGNAAAAQVPAAKRRRVGGSGSASATLSESEMAAFNASAAGGMLRRFQASAEGATIAPELFSFASGALMGLNAMRDSTGGVLVEATAVHANPEAHGNLPSMIVLARICAGSPVSIAALRSAVGGHVWADGTLRVVPDNEQTTLQKSLPPSEPRSQETLRQGLMPLIAGFSIPTTAVAAHDESERAPPCNGSKDVGIIPPPASPTATSPTGVGAAAAAVDARSTGIEPRKNTRGILSSVISR